MSQKFLQVTIKEGLNEREAYLCVDNVLIVEKHSDHRMSREWSRVRFGGGAVEYIDVLLPYSELCTAIDKVIDE